MLGLAVSLSVQGALSNLSNGIMLLITKPFKAGDYIAAAGIEGTVKEISMLCTKIITVDNKDIFVPNSEIAGGKITNFSSEPVRRVDIVIRAGYNNDIATVKKALTEAVAATDNTLNDPAPFIRLSGYKEYAVEYTIRVWAQAPITGMYILTAGKHQQSLCRQWRQRRCSRYEYLYAGR